MAEGTEPLTVRELAGRLAAIPPDVRVLVCPDEPHVACHLVVAVEEWDPEDADPYVSLRTLDPGPAAAARRQRQAGSVLVACIAEGCDQDAELPDYTEDSRPNVMVAFAIERPMLPENEMRKLAEERYPTIWARLGVRV